MKADNEATFAKNEFAIDRLRTDMERIFGGLSTDNEKAIDRLRTDMERTFGGLRADNEKAIGGLRTDFGQLRADMEKSVNTITMRVIGIVSLGFAILGGFIAILQLLT